MHVRDQNGSLVLRISKFAFETLLESDIGTWIPFDGKGGKMVMVYKIHTRMMWTSPQIDVYFWEDYVVVPEDA